MSYPDRWCPKLLIEALSQQQTHAPDNETRDDIGYLIWLLQRHRPVGPNGKHGDLHTPTCGCGDAASGVVL